MLFVIDREVGISKNIKILLTMLLGICVCLDNRVASVRRSNSGYGTVFRDYIFWYCVFVYCIANCNRDTVYTVI